MQEAQGKSQAGWLGNPRIQERDRDRQRIAGEKRAFTLDRGGNSLPVPIPEAATGSSRQDVLHRQQPAARRDTLGAGGDPDWNPDSRIDREVMVGRVRPSGAARGIGRDRGPGGARSGNAAECGPQSGAA